MERRVVKPPGQDMIVERLKSLYGLAGSCSVEQEFSNFDQTKYKRRILTSPEDLDTYCSGDRGVSSLRCYSDERKHPTTPFCSSFKHLNVNCLDDELDSFHNLKKWETEKELTEDDHRDSASKITKQSFREIEKDALPTNIASSRLHTEHHSDSVDSPLKHVIYPKSKVSNKQSLLPHQINQIYDELFHIHLKLQCETASQQKFAEELQQREWFLAEREQLLFRHETALSKIKADYLAQAFDSLCLDLKTDEGKTLFLEYQAVPVILKHLRISSKGLLSNAIDSLLQMTVESKSLQPFLEACSNSLFFRTCSVLLRTPKLDLHILEKLSIILQKLSKIKSTKTAMTNSGQLAADIALWLKENARHEFPFHSHSVTAHTVFTPWKLPGPLLSSAQLSLNFPDCRHEDQAVICRREEAQSGGGDNSPLG
ncbi:coiled-coil domain containing 138 [Cricetulus griseus]